MWTAASAKIRRSASVRGRGGDPELEKGKVISFQAGAQATHQHTMYCNKRLVLRIALHKIHP